jgi:nitroreductase
MASTAATLHPITMTSLHPLLASRFSPTRFDADHAIGTDEVELLVEAARWAPSAGNSQPWSFVPAVRGTQLHAALVGHLAPSTRRWAPDAALLIVSLAHRRVEDTEWMFSEFADYDLGQAVAHLTFQAQAMGLAVRQFRAFGLEAVTQQIDPDPGWDVVAMVAVGRAAGLAPDNRERRPLSEVMSPRAPWPTCG